jgi:hypothetical protein
MILNDDTHEYSCTRCRHTGSACMEGLWLAQRIARSMAAGDKTLPDDYDVSCSSRFLGCGRTCHTILRVTMTDVQVFCGTEPLGLRLATEGFGMETPTSPSLPSAMVVAVVLSEEQRDRECRVAAEA